MGYPRIAHGTVAGIDPAALATLDLTEDQRRNVTEVQRDLQRKQWALTGQLRELRWKQEDAMSAPEIDAEAARKTYNAIAVSRQELFEASLDARKRIEALLTKEQRLQLAERTRALARANLGAVSAGSRQKTDRH